MPTDDIPQVIEGAAVVVVERDTELFERLGRHGRERAERREKVFLTQRLRWYAVLTDLLHANVPQPRVAQTLREEGLVRRLVARLQQPSHGRVAEAHAADGLRRGLAVRQRRRIGSLELEARAQDVHEEL